MTTLAIAVTCPELTGNPRIVSLESSFLICVSLKAMPLIWLASAGRVRVGDVVCGLLEVAYVLQQGLLVAAILL
ncbi:MAG: hypothetical protein Ct9H300mP8_05280 [Gammaproteobacteria bacterium]|nr:MAG: hypothetical protein Ct9H300mP8_05280 [Gammaproteobacteria bacterium]